MVKKETIRAENIKYIGGKYRFVNHKEGLATEGFNSEVLLAIKSRDMAFDDINIALMKIKYCELYPKKEVLSGQPFGGLEITSITLHDLNALRFGTQFKVHHSTLTRRDLELNYWGRLHDMVNEYNAKHSCDVKPWGCVSVVGTPSQFAGHPEFTGQPEDYRLAVTIAWDEEGKMHRPVFIGNVLEDTHGGQYVAGKFGWIGIKNNEHANTYAAQTRMTWPSTKREFEINGEKFTSPVSGLDMYELGYVLRMGEEKFYFRKREDRDSVRNAFRDLLIKARDK